MQGKHILITGATNGNGPAADLVAQLDDTGFELTTRPQRIGHFTAFLNRIGTMKAKVSDWKELFWETAHHQKGD